MGDFLKFDEKQHTVKIIKDFTVFVGGDWVSIPSQTICLDAFVPAPGQSINVLLSIAAGGSIIITPGTTELPPGQMALAFVRLKN